MRILSVVLKSFLFFLFSFALIIISVLCLKMFNGLIYGSFSLLSLCLAGWLSSIILIFSDRYKFAWISLVSIVVFSSLMGFINFEYALWFLPLVWILSCFITMFTLKIKNLREMNEKHLDEKITTVDNTPMWKIFDENQ